MGPCKGCKHWLKNMPPTARAHWEGNLPQRELNDLAQESGSICVLMTDADRVDTARVINGIYADSPAYLITPPEFGCVLWEVKDAA